MEQNMKELQKLRAQMSKVNEAMMQNLNDFFKIAYRIGEVKDNLGLPHFDPVRESEMLKELEKKNMGPMSQDMVRRIFKEIFKASVDEMEVEYRKRLQVQSFHNGKTIIKINDINIGGEKPCLIAGPCSIENYEQTYMTAKRLKELGIDILRGGAFKPRTSPYSFQGLEEEGLKILRAVADDLHMVVITEVLNVQDIPLVLEYVDILQVGTRNMFNYSLLKDLGKINKPVMIKRGFMATIDELLFAAEYVYIGGNQQIILCERGIRTFETQTRNTLDISCVPILKKETPLPVIVDITHSLGRKDIIKPIAHAALVAGADGLMFESHYNPSIALSDSSQQLDLKEAEELISYLKDHFSMLSG